RVEPGISLADRIKDLTDWLAEGEASASQGYLTSGEGPTHRPSRAWYGQVMPGSWAPNVDSDGVEGKIAGIADIRAHDPGFDENVFLAQVQRLFFAVLEAWTALKPALSQGVMASLIWEEQKAQVAAYAHRGWRTVLTSQSCPNCGASVNVDITSICPYCDAAVISGKFGWLLTRIDRI